MMDTRSSNKIEPAFTRRAELTFAWVAASAAVTKKTDLQAFNLQQSVFRIVARLNGARAGDHTAQHHIFWE
jgi:hypothetical protein